MHDLADPRLRIALALGLAALGACGGASDVRRINEVRVTRAVGDDRPWGGSSAQRFGFAAGDGHAHAGGGAPAATSAAAAGELAWTTPPGWSERPPSAMRQGDWQLPDGAECSLTLLPGGGGGLEANVQRWRGQMSLPPATPAELAALPRATLLGAEARVLELSGTWVGMQGGAPRTEFALLGLLSHTGGEARFLKLVGPAARVAAERERFFALAASLRRAGAPGEPPAARRGPPAAPIDPGQAPAAELQRASGLAWRVPAGWREAPARPFRVVSFASEEHPDVECYVTLLRGDGGGVEANIARWREQLGAPGAPAGVVERRALELVGGGGTLVELEGAGGRALLGAVRALGDRTLFVKLTGPRDALASERERFLALCGSLAEAGR